MSLYLLLLTGLSVLNPILGDSRSLQSSCHSPGTLRNFKGDYLELQNCNSTTFANLNFLAVTHLVLLQLEKSTFSVLRENQFSNFKNLQNLELGSNTIGGVQSGAFNNLSQLRRLSLRSSGITKLPNDILFPLRELEHLDLSDNQITSLSEDIFSRNENLRTLLLNSNPLTNVGELIFDPFRSLQLLDMSNCGPLGDLTLYGAQTLILENSGITELNITGGVIKLQAANNELTSFSIANNESVIDMDLHGNRLDDDAVKGLNKMRNLQRLDMSHNDISLFLDRECSNIFELWSLKYLNMSHNLMDIKMINGYTFEGPILPLSVTHLDISHNNIDFNIDWLKGILNLQSLRLEGNYIGNSQRICKSIPSLKEVALFDTGNDGGDCREAGIHVIEKTSNVATEIPVPKSGELQHDELVKTCKEAGFHAEESATSIAAGIQNPRFPCVHLSLKKECKECERSIRIYTFIAVLFILAVINAVAWFLMYRKLFLSRVYL